MKNIAIILAAGSAKRCGFDKCFDPRFGTPIIFRTLEKFQQCSEINEIILVLSEANFSRQNEVLQKFTKISKIICGGAERFFSFKKAIEFLQSYHAENARILVHNGANPNISVSEISHGLALAAQKKNIVFGFFTPNSIKQVEAGKVINFLDREQIFETQTPQISDLKTFVKAIEKWEKHPVSSPKMVISKNIPKDEAELLNFIGEEIFVYECSPENQKITFAEDFYKISDFSFSGARIGIGEDSHRFSENFDSQKPFRLGGISFENEKLTSTGNSDGDIIFHALCNALLSAFGAKTFDPIAGAIFATGETNSIAYLLATIQYLKEKFKIKDSEFSISQILVSLEGSRPRLAPVHDLIQENIARAVGIEKSRVGLTYTTGEDLTEFGKGKGMKCFVLVRM